MTRVILEIILNLIILYPLSQKLEKLWSEIISCESVVDGCLEKSEFISCIIAVSFHLESIDIFSVIDHTSECIGKTDLTIFTRSRAIESEILEYFWCDDIFSYDTESGSRLFGFWLLEKF